MKIIQSLYTNSFLNNDSDISKIRTPSGVSTKEINIFFWYCWFNSVMSFVEKGLDVELVTDNIGQDILINKLGMPYKTVKTELEDINCKSKTIWAIGKLKTYSIQTTPFLHFDGDAFYKKQIPNINCPLFLQEINYVESNYQDLHYVCAKDIVKNFKDVPEQIKKIIYAYDHQTHVCKTNVGVIGGNDVDLLNHYSSTMLKFIDKNCQQIDEFLSKQKLTYRTIFMSVLEELSLLEFYKEKYGSLDDVKTAIGHYTLKHHINDAQYIKKAEQTSKETGYVHCMSSIKNNNSERAVIFRKKLIDDTRKKYPEYAELLDYYLNK